MGLLRTGAIQRNSSLDTAKPRDVPDAATAPPNSRCSSVSYQRPAITVRTDAFSNSGPAETSTLM
jgi:hypothetical protein